MDVQQVVEEIVETAKEYAKDFMFYGTSSIPEDPDFTATVINWQKFQNSLIPKDRDMAVRAFREVIGEE